MTQDNDPKMPDDERDPIVPNEAWQRSIDAAVKDAEASGKGKGHLQNTRSYGKMNSLENQAVGCHSPEDYDQDAAIAHHRRWEDKEYKPDYRVKRNDILKNQFRAIGAEGPLAIASAFKVKQRAPEIKFWNDDEHAAIQENITKLSESPDTLLFAVMGVIAMFASPRVSDIASAKWADFKWEQKVFSFIAQKNGNRCTAPLNGMFYTIMRSWSDFLKDFEGGGVWVFPKSIIAKEGGRRNDSPIISEKTVRKHLNEKVRDPARLPDGSTVQKLSPHHWRHTNAIRILIQTGDYYLVKGLLGDSIKTIESRYSTFIYNEANGKVISKCLGGESGLNPAPASVPVAVPAAPRDRDGRNSIWPYRQMVAVANGKGKSGISPNDLATQVFQSAELDPNRPASPHSESRPSFLEFFTREDEDDKEGSSLNSGYGGLGQIDPTDDGQGSDGEYSGPGEI